MKRDVNRLIELQGLLNTFNQVERVNTRHHLGTIVPENDVEHSYNLAMTAWFLADQFPELNKDLLIKFALIHDLVEVHAGDTYAYGSEEDKHSKVEREALALEKLKQDWHDFKDMTELIETYETKDSAEAKFVYALDKLMPAMSQLSNKTHHWKNHGINTKMFYDSKVDKVKVSPEVNPIFEELYEMLLNRPDLIDRG